MVIDFTREAFLPFVNIRFRVPDKSVEIELIEARDLGSTPRQEQFSLLFRGPLDALLSQKTYRVEHDRVEPFDLFLVPVKKDENGFYYEAVFNRFL